MQSILYLQASGSSPTSDVIGMALFVDGEQKEVPSCSQEWPYARITDALKDGWRVVKFPELALLLDERRNYALGCEFVLERETASQ